MGVRGALFYENRHSIKFVENILKIRQDSPNLPLACCVMIFLKYIISFFLMLPIMLHASDEGEWEVVRPHTKKKQAPFSPAQEHHTPLSEQDITRLQKCWYSYVDYNALSTLLMRSWSSGPSGRSAKKDFCDQVFRDFFENVPVSDYNIQNCYQFLSATLLFQRRDMAIYHMLSQLFFIHTAEDEKVSELAKAYTALGVIDRYRSIIQCDSSVSLYDDDLSSLKNSFTFLKNMAKNYPVFALYYGTLSFVPVVNPDSFDVLNAESAYQLILAASKTGVAFSHTSSFSTENPQGLSLSESDRRTIYQNIYKFQNQHKKSKYISFKKSAEKILKAS